MATTKYKKVLILDDDSSSNRLMKTQLTSTSNEAAGYKVVAFIDPLAALAHAKTHRLDAVISDLHMPSMDGIAFVKAFATIQPQCARLVLSGHSDTDVMLRMVDEAHIHRFIPKPWNREELVTLLGEAIASVERPDVHSGHTLPRPTSTTLRTAPLLADLPDATLVKLATVVDWQVYDAGETLVRQGDKTKSVYFIISGCLKVMRGDPLVHTGPADGVAERRVGRRQQVMLSLIGPGDMVGEVATLLDRGRSASIVALTPCQVIRLGSDDFLACLLQNPLFALAITRKMAQRLVSASLQVELMRGDLEGRIHAVLRHCKAIGVDTDRWLNNTEIARMVGATRVAVSVIMSRMARENGMPAKK